MEQSLKEKLDRNIWITRKCRINASERLLSHAKYIEILNVYYSIFVIILSLLSLTEQDNFLSIISLACSIALMISIIYANSAGYRDRSSSLKQNYIELQLLLDQLSCTRDDDTECIMSISAKYADLLKASENHIPIDLYRLKANSTDSTFASVDKGIHNKTTKYGLPTYWNYRPNETQGGFFIGRGRRYPYKRGLTAKSQALFSCHQIRRRKCEWPMKKQKS